MQVIHSPFNHDALELVAFDRRTGAIALSSARTVKIYEELVTFDPNATTIGATEQLSIRWRYTFETIVEGTHIRSLSWGLGRELLVGNDRLSLFHPPSSSPRSNNLRSSWSFPLSSEIETAQFSPDASFIASYGRHDRLIKVWRRLSDRVTSSGLRTSDFDFIYLPHDRAVSELRWRQPFYEDLLVDNIVYTTSLDSKLRAWASDIPHDGHLLTLHESIPLISSTQLAERVPVVIDDEVLSWALAKALKRRSRNDKATEAIALLQDISKGQPELVVTLSVDGSMLAYALHDLGNRSHSSSSQKLFFSRNSIALLEHGDNNTNVRITATTQRVGEADLLFVVYRPTSITLFQADLIDLFTDDSELTGLQELFVFDGHNTPITNITIDSGNCIITKDSTDKSILWSRLGQHLTSAQRLKALDGQHTKNGQALPKYLSLTEPISLHSITNNLVAIVVQSQPNEVQIWASMLPSSFSGAPECTLDLGAQIHAIAWDTSSDDQASPILCVCTKDTIQLCQAQILKSEAMHSWSVFQSFQLSEWTQEPVSHCLYTAIDYLVVVTGSMMFTFSTIDWTSDLALPRVQTTLPIYHPAFIKQLLTLGDLGPARVILATLHDRLVDSHNGTDLKIDLDLAEELILGASSRQTHSKKPSKNKYNALFNNDEQESAPEAGILSSAKAASLLALLRDLDIPNLTLSEKGRLSIIASALVKVEADESSLDPSGLRFYLSYMILQERKQRYPKDACSLSDEDVLWAQKSDKQDILLTLVKSSVRSLTWQEAKAAKIFYWLKNRTALLDVAEIIGKAEFLKGDDRDPVSASLWYLALHKKTVLLSLWRTSGSHPEHNLTTKILSNDFEVPKWRTTANKNAFALIGRRRYEYAAAWFLLGSSLKDAVSVCLRNLEDHDLALAVARIYSDDRSEITRSLVKSTIFDFAKTKGSRFLGCWCHEFLGDFESSMDTLMSPFSIATKDSPAIAEQYLTLRNMLGAHSREPEFVEYLVYLLNLRGCPQIAAHLVRSWTHRLPTTKVKADTVNVEVTLEEFKERQKEKLVEAPKAVFEEPTMDSFAAFDF